jgi:hypothetical protein
MAGVVGFWFRLSYLQKKKDKWKLLTRCCVLCRCCIGGSGGVSVSVCGEVRQVEENGLSLLLLYSFRGWGSFRISLLGLGWGSFRIKDKVKWQVTVEPGVWV